VQRAAGGRPRWAQPGHQPTPRGGHGDVHVSAATQGSITNVTRQQVTTAARPGDRIELTLVGVESDAPAALSLCVRGTAGGADACGPTTQSATDADGGLTASLDVPAGQTAGDGFVRAVVGAEPDASASAEADEQPRASAGQLTVDTVVRFLGEPTVATADGSTDARLKVEGAEWDPQREIRLRLLDDDKVVGEVVRATADDQGALRATVRVPEDTDVSALEVVQQRPGGPLAATLSLDISAAPKGGDDEEEDEKEDESEGDGTTTSTTPVASSPTTDPLAIPEPDPELEPKLVDPKAPVAVVGDVAVTEATLEGEARIRELFGAGPRRELRLAVENIGSGEVVAPGLMIGVGKGDEVEPVFISDGLGRLAAGERRILEIPIALPVGAMGTYTVTGRVGDADTGEFALTWETYPWGLFMLNVLAAVLVGYAVQRRIRDRRTTLVTAAVGAVPLAGATAGDAVIDIAALDRWWALRAADGVVGGGEALDDAVVDLAEVDRWMRRCADREAQGGDVTAA
jgi:hypothetical protein